MKRFFSLMLALLFLMPGMKACGEAAARTEDPATEAETQTEAAGTEQPETTAETAGTVDYQHLKVANPTPLTGHFFTTLWGASTSDLDVQELLHRYKLVVYDNDLGRYRMNHLVVAGAVMMDDEEGNRTYHFALCDDLEYSDGTKITVWDYVFTFLLMADPAIAQAGGIPADESWILGMEEYLSGESRVLSGIRVINDYLFSVTVKAEALPYFYELSRFRISPYPISVIAPGCRVRDDGDGAYLTPGLTGEILKKTVLDSYTGYMTAPKIVSGSYTIEGYRNGKAHLVVNPRYKGNQDGETPAIPELTYGGADGEEMVQALESGELGLLNKVTNGETIQKCFELMRTYSARFRMTSYPRTGLTVIRFMPRSPRVQETAVRQAVFYCLDRESIVKDYLDGFGLPVKGLYGMGQWMVRLLDGPASYPIYLNEENATEAEVRAYKKDLEVWQSMDMDQIPEYSLDVEKAAALLEENGWTLNRFGDPYDGGVRYRKTEDGQLIGLDMKIAIPANMRKVLEEHWAPYMEQAGFSLEMIDREILGLAETYRRDSVEDCDMVLVGEDFTDMFRLNGGYLRMEKEEKDGEENAAARMPLEELDDRVEAMTVEVYHTEQSDLQGFIRKWLDLQIEVAETVPVIPVYSNVYFDFYETELQGYRVEDYLGWGNAIVAAWLGDGDAGPEEEGTDG